MKVPWTKSCILIGCVSTHQGLSYLAKTSVPVDLIEIRLDVLRQNHVPIEDIKNALQTRKIPALLTLRTTHEGGEYPWKSRERAMLFRQFLPLVDVVDVELANALLLRPTLRLVRQQRKGLILSAHSIKRKLTPRKMERLLKEFRAYRAQVYKIASLARNRKDLAVLAETLVSNPRTNLALMAIGPLAEVSRVVLPALGSRLVYGYLDVPTAKTQPSAQDLYDKLKALSVL